MGTIKKIKLIVTDFISSLSKRMSIKLLQTLNSHDERVWSLSWNHNGTLFASCGGDKHIKIWGKEGDEWTCKSSLTEQHNRTVRAVSWSPCGKLLAAASFDSTVSIWDRSEGEFECITTLEGHDNEVKAVGWSVSGNYLATCSRDKTVWVWEVDEDDYECASVLNKHSQDVKKITWHPHLDMFASCSYDDTINVYKEDDDDWMSYGTLTGHTSTVWSIAFDKTGDRLVSCSDDQTIKIWQCYYPNNHEGVVTTGNDPTWKCVCTLSGYHDRPVYDVDWSHRSGLIASAGGDDCINIFQEDMETSTKNEPCFKLLTSMPNAHLQDINCVRWNPADSTVLITCSDDMTINMWCVQDFEN